MVEMTQDELVYETPLVHSRYRWQAIWKIEIVGELALLMTSHVTAIIVPPQAGILAVWGIAVLSSVDNFLRPRLVGERVGLSELVMFFSVLGGLQVFGFLGIVLGPVLFAVVTSLVDVLSGEPVVPDSGQASPRSGEALPGRPPASVV